MNARTAFVFLAAIIAGITAIISDAASGQEQRARGSVSDAAPGLPAPGLAGSWLVYVNCVEGPTRRGAAARTIPAFLDIKEGGTLTADLYVIETYAPAARMTGSYDAQTRRLELRAREWIYPSRTVTEPPVITASLENSGMRLQGNIVLLPNLRQCAPFQAFKFTRDRRPVNPKGLIAAFPDARDAYKLRDERLCKDFLTWNVEGSIIETQGEEIPSQLVDGDVFYQVVGKPYDQWTDSDKRVFQGLLTACRHTFQRSPIIEHTSLLARERANRKLSMFLNPGLPDRPDQMRHYTYLKRYALVTALRNARLHADYSVSAAAASKATRENRNWIASTAEDIRQGAGIFAALGKADAASYAERLNGQQERMTGELGRMALARAETEIAGIRGMTDAHSQIAALNALYLGKTDYHDLLLPPDLPVLKSRIADEQRAVCRRAIDPVIAGLEALPASDAAFEQIDETEKKLAPALPLLVDGLDQGYRRRMEQTRMDMLPELIAQRLALLDTYPAGRKGLAQSAKWPAELHALLGAYEGLDIYSSAMEQYRNFRNRLLLDSLPEFQAAMKQGAADIDAIYGQYLSWEGDAALPAARDYAFIRQLYK